MRHFLIETYAYMPPGQAVSDVDEAEALRRPSDQVHSIAEIVAHIDFWQSWFLDRCRGEASPMIQSAAFGWPEVRQRGWVEVRERFFAGLASAASLGEEPDALTRRIEPPIEFPPLASYTVNDALIHVSTHNAHHLGQIITLRQVMGLWPPASGSWTW